MPGKETLVGAFTGVPYTYPSQVKIGKEGSRTFFTIDPVHWYTDPFHNPIYYGARVARWGARTGVMVDFIHSKAMARLGEEANFKGSIDGNPLPARAPHLRHRRQDGVLARPQHAAVQRAVAAAGDRRAREPLCRRRRRRAAAARRGRAHERAGHHRTYEYNYAGPAGQALAGVEIRLARISLFVEYKFTYGHYGAPLSQMDGSWLFLDLWRQVKRWIDGVEPPGGPYRDGDRQPPGRGRPGGALRGAALETAWFRRCRAGRCYYSRSRHQPGARFSFWVFEAARLTRQHSGGNGVAGSESSRLLRWEDKRPGQKRRSRRS